MVLGAEQAGAASEFELGGAGARRLIRQRLVKFFGDGLVDFALQGALFVSQLAGYLGDRFGFFE